VAQLPALEIRDDRGPTVGRDGEVDVVRVHSQTVRRVGAWRQYAHRRSDNGKPTEHCTPKLSFGTA
jgi:hypothetical protein